MTQLPALDYDRRTNRALSGGEPRIFHCHHYNLFLQQTLLDAEFVDTRPILIGAAAEVAFAELRTLFAELEVAEPEVRRGLAEQHYARCGFGRLSLPAAIGEAAEARSSHYAAGAQARGEACEEPVDLFTRGWIGGALAAIHDLPLGQVAVEVTEALELGAPRSRYETAHGEAGHPVWESPGPGRLRELPDPPMAGPLDRAAIRDAVLGLPLEGGEDGLIQGFGVILTRHYANYYNRVSFELARALEARFGDQGWNSAEPLLTEAGRVCAFFTLGGIMTSSEWDALIRPHLTCREDWIHGAVSVIEAFGWGRWEAASISEEAAEFVISNGYEGVGYEAMYGAATRDIAWLARGGVVGLMALLYLGDIDAQPALTPELYERIFKGEAGYEAEVLESLAMGAERTRIRVTRR